MLRLRWPRCSASAGRTCRRPGLGHSHSVYSPAAKPRHGDAGRYSYLSRPVKVKSIPATTSGSAMPSPLTTLRHRWVIDLTLAFQTITMRHTLETKEVL
jgi:hypothetical protein